jgi:hypothetical protein
MQEEVKSPSKGRLWLKRIGIAGFLFFLIKGLIWLVLVGWLGKEYFFG